MLITPFSTCCPIFRTLRIDILRILAELNTAICLVTRMGKLKKKIVSFTLYPMHTAGQQREPTLLSAGYSAAWRLKKDNVKKNKRIGVYRWSNIFWCPNIHVYVYKLYTSITKRDRTREIIYIGEVNSMWYLIDFVLRQKENLNFL